MDKGWIKLHRSLQNHWLWNSKEPFDKRSAWIDLLMLANFTDLKVMRKGKLTSRSRGEVNTSMEWLAERWVWDRRTVKRFLKTLEGDGMVSLHSTTDGTTVTIEKYDFFQSQSTSDGTAECTTQCTPECTTEGTTQGTHDKNAIKKSINNAINNGENHVPVGQPYRDPITGMLRFNTGR